MQSLENAIVDYFGREIPITPIDENKVAFVNNWTLYDGLSCQQKFKILADKGQKLQGIGLMCGKVSGIIALDIDTLNEKLQEQIIAELPPLFCARRGNPKKQPTRFFKYNGERLRHFTTIGVDILSDGSQCALPPTFHKTAKVHFQWVGKSLLDIDLDDLPILPDGFIQFLDELNKSLESGKKVGSVINSNGNRSNHGSHNHLSKLAVKLFFQGYKFEEIKNALLEEDIKINPKISYFNCPSRTEFGPSSNANLNRFVAEVIFRNSNKVELDNAFTEARESGFTKYTESGKYYRDYISISAYFKVLYRPIYVPDRKCIMVFDGKKYVDRDDSFIRQFAQNNFSNPICTKSGEVEEFLKLEKRREVMLYSEFNKLDGNIINFENGIFDISKNTLYKHDYKYRFTYVVPNKISQNDVAPVWDELLKVVTVNRIKIQTFLEEFIGYILSGESYDAHNISVIFDGPGANGKSTIVRIIQGLIGKDNCSAVSFSDMSRQQFALSGLIDKLVNFCAEEPKEAFSETGVFKKITGGDPVMVEEKHRSAFMYEIKSKFIISYNEVPFLADTTKGMQRRLVILPFDQDFDANAHLKIKDPVKRILGCESGAVLNRCVKRYQKVKLRGAFTEVDESKERLDEMVRDSNPIVSFVDGEIEYTGDVVDFVSTNDLYRRFVDQYAEGTRMQKRGFAKRFKTHFKKENLVNDRRWNGLSKERGFCGIRFKD